MKRRNLVKTLFAVLISISILFTTVLAAPSAVTLSDLSSDNSVVDSSAKLLETGDYALSILNKPGTTFVLSRGEYTYDVCDLWKEVESDGTGELKFDQSFSVNINNAVDAYNNYLDTEYPNGERDQYKASEDNNNGAIFYVQARVLINDYAFDFSSRASYMYAPYGLDGEYNEGCGEWNISSYYDDLSDFLTMSKDGGVLNLSLDGTVKEIYEALKAQDEALGDVTINNLEFELRVSCEVEYRGSWGNINYTEYGFDGLSLTLYDKHIYESASEYDNLSVIPTTAPITVNVAPALEGCYEPVKTEYSWYYEFIKEGEEEAEDGNYKWYGYFERDESKESDVLTETAPSGTVYGIAYGKVDSDSNSITLDDILNEDNKAFIGSFIGEKPRELGGKGQIFIGCAVTLTFEDGKQWVVEITKADYMSRLIMPCMHACTVCGLCTVTDEMLPCNFDQMSYDISNVCMCEEPSVPEYEITVESKEQMTIESTGVTVDVVVEQVEVEEIPPNSFIINAAEAVGTDNVMAFYNIDVFDQDGYPYTLNRYYDEGEELTVSISVSIEEALALQNGEAALYHILADGTAEVVEGVIVVIDGESATMTFTSSSFSPYIIARTATADVTIDTVNIIGVATPIVGKTYDLSGITTDTDGITLGTIQWQKSNGTVMLPTDVFEEGVEYMLYIAYTVDDGYVLSDTVGVTSDLDYDSNYIGRVWIGLYYTANYIPVNTVNITGVTTPVAGENYDLTGITTDTDGITLGTIQWQKSNGTVMQPTDVFEEGVEYMLYIAYTIDDGYELSDTAEVTSDLDYDSNYIGRIWIGLYYTVPKSEPDSIEINLGAKADATNVRYAEIDGIVTEITEENDKYIPEIGEDNLLIEVVEKTQSGEFVKSQYFYVDTTTKTATKLGMDSYMTADSNTSIRTNNPMGIRFKSSVLTSAKSEETQFEIDEYGFIVATEEALADTELTLEFSKYVTGVAYNKESGTDVVFDASDDEVHIFSGYVKNIPVENYKTNLVCKTYTKITVNGEQFTIYGEKVVGNVYDTAKALLEDDTLDTETRNVLVNITLAYENTIGLPGDDLFPED